MYQIVYVSSEAFRFTEGQLTELLHFSRRRNTESNVTGILLYLNGNFIQLLEGVKDDVLNTFARIKSDNRHRGVNTLFDAPCEKRDFQDWSMAFERLEAPESEKLPGYSQFLSQPANDDTHRSAALQLLECFKTIAR